MCAPARADTRVRPYNIILFSGLSKVGHESLAYDPTDWKVCATKTLRNVPC